MTTGEVQAHLAEVYGAEVSRETISKITDRVLEGMVNWQNRPLDNVYPVVFIAAIVVKIRDGQVANRLNARFRRAVKTRGHFPTEQAALKHLYLTICSLDPTGRGRQRWTTRWKVALNAFAITSDGRILTNN